MSHVASRVYDKVESLPSVSHTPAANDKYSTGKRYQKGLNSETLGRDSPGSGMYGGYTSCLGNQQFTQSKIKKSKAFGFNKA